MKNSYFDDSKDCVKTQLPQTCKRCESNNLDIRPGAGPHGAGVWCLDCESKNIGGFQKWLSKSLVANLRERGLLPW